MARFFTLDTKTLSTYDLSIGNKLNKKKSDDIRIYTLTIMSMTGHGLPCQGL